MMHFFYKPFVFYCFLLFFIYGCNNHIDLNKDGSIRVNNNKTLILNKTDKPYILRGIIRKRIWDCEKKLNKNEKFFSEAGQDKLIKDNFFKNQHNGFFIEIGAFDGIEGSNCHYFEKYENWEGVAIEASPKQFQKLERNRKCEKINAVIGPEEKEVEFCEITEGFTQMSGIYNSIMGRKAWFRPKF